MYFGINIFSFIQLKGSDEMKCIKFLSTILFGHRHAILISFVMKFSHQSLLLSNNRQMPGKVGSLLFSPRILDTLRSKVC